MGTDSSAACPTLTGTGGNAGPLDWACGAEPQPVARTKRNAGITARIHSCIALQFSMDGRSHSGRLYRNSRKAALHDCPARGERFGLGVCLLFAKGKRANRHLRFDDFYDVVVDRLRNFLEPVRNAGGNDDDVSLREVMNFAASHILSAPLV